MGNVSVKMDGLLKICFVRGEGEFTLLFTSFYA